MWVWDMQNELSSGETLSNYYSGQTKANRRKGAIGWKQTQSAERPESGCLQRRSLLKRKRSTTYARDSNSIGRWKTCC